LILLAILGSFVLYFRYVVKLKRSHRNIFILLTISLYFLAIFLIAFFVFIGLYIDNPKNMKNLLYFAFIPYYLSLFIIIGLYIYLSPGFSSNGPAVSADIIKKKEKK
jgi:hypothetical protein